MDKPLDLWLFCRHVACCDGADNVAIACVEELPECIETSTATDVYYNVQSLCLSGYAYTHVVDRAVNSRHSYFNTVTETGNNTADCVYIHKHAVVCIEIREPCFTLVGNEELYE